MLIASRVCSRLTPAALALFFISIATNQSSSQVEAGSIRPTLRLEKTRYLKGESIRFWVGVEVKNSQRIPTESQKPCSLNLTMPDGASEVQSISWPIDGDPSRGWSGGWGIPQEKAEVGSYTLVLECVGSKTEPVQLAVENNEISNQIKVEFQFERSGSIEIGASVPVVFSVTNNSAYTVRFPRRGAMMEGISLSVQRDDPAYHSDFFYPSEKLAQSSIMPDVYSWAATKVVPTVTLLPGRRFERRLLLEDAYKFDEPGNYEVTFATVLSTLVGERNGIFADLCPIRLMAEATERFAVAAPSHPR